MREATRRQFLGDVAAGAMGLAAARMLRSAPAAAEAAGAGTAGAGAPNAPGASREKPEKPLNFVFFLVDDMGWMDVSCNGSKVYRTPHVDELARRGMRFTNGYAACPVCSPTRASILTGKYPARLHLTDWIPGHVQPRAKLRVPDWTMHMPLEEVTLAEALKPAGYATASIGKWHLGGPAYWPEKQGFDVNFAGCAAGQPPSYFYPYKFPNVSTGRVGEHLSDRLTDEAEKFIEANKDRPFFLYLPHYAVHQPIQPRKDLLAQELSRGLKPKGQNAAPYAALIDGVDISLGRILDKLDQLQIADRTVIIFMSDNGGLLEVTSNAPLRAGKGYLYEGGIREPLIVCWPGVTRPGSTCDVPVSSIDFYPTILEMAATRDEASHKSDGVSFASLLRGGTSLDRDSLYWHYPHYHRTKPGGVIRKGDFKLIEFFEDGRVELYNLRDDLRETTDLSAKMPEKTAELKQALHAWRQSVGAQMPTPNPDYVPARASEPAKTQVPEQ